MIKFSLFFGFRYYITTRSSLWTFSRLEAEARLSKNVYQIWNIELFFSYFSGFRLIATSSTLLILWTPLAHFNDGICNLQIKNTSSVYNIEILN